MSNTRTVFSGPYIPISDNVLKKGAYTQCEQLNTKRILEDEKQEQPKQTCTPMTAQETSVHSTSKHRWLIVFGLSVGLVPNSQPHTFTAQYLRMGSWKGAAGIAKLVSSLMQFLLIIFPQPYTATDVSWVPRSCLFPFYLHLSPPCFLFLFD